MRRLVFLLAVLASLAGAGQARAADFACVGPPADYVQAFDQVRGQANDGEVTYPYKTVYLEYQGWLTPNDGVSTPGHHSEHTHHGACLPNGQVLNDANASPWFVDARIIAHNIEHYTVSSFTGSFVGKGGSQSAFAASPAQVSEINAAFLASGGLETQTVFQSYQVNIPNSDGIKELKWQIQMDRNSPAALVDFWRMNGRSYFTLDYAGHTTGVPLGDPTCFIDFVRTQNWIEFDDEQGVHRSQYGYAGFQESQLSLDGPCTHPAAFSPDALAQNRPEPWTTTLRTTDGTNRLFAFVDPNFHAHPDTNAWSIDLGNPANSGTLVQQGYNNAITVPLDTLNLAGGVHRLMVQGHKWPNQTGIQPINSIITVMPFFVTAPDQPPTMPPNAHRVNTTATSLKLTWNASTDDVAVTGYKVWLDNNLYATVGPTTLGKVISGLSPQPHSIGVSAIDGAGNESPRSQWTVNPQPTAPWWTPSAP